MDMHWKIGICQDARKHKERVDGLCPRWFAPAASGRNSTNIRSHVPKFLKMFAPSHLCVFALKNPSTLQADQRVGQWSDVVSIPVAG
jgi:hypothetical protein